MTVPNNPVERLKDWFDGGSKWHKGGLYGPDGSACLIGASQKTSNREALMGVPDIIREQYADRVGDRRIVVIGVFNDHPDTTWPDVELVLDKAALKWEETR